MRWPFGPPHLTLKQKQKTKHKKQKTKNKKQKTKKAKEKTKTQKNIIKTRKTSKTPKYPKRSFSVISQSFLFWWGSKISLLWQLGQKSAHPKNAIKLGLQQSIFWEKRCAWQNGHFWTKKPKTKDSSYQFFLFLLKNKKLLSNFYF